MECAEAAACKLDEQQCGLLFGVRKGEVGYCACGRSDLLACEEVFPIVRRRKGIGSRPAKKSPNGETRLRYVKELASATDIPEYPLRHLQSVCGWRGFPAKPPPTKKMNQTQIAKALNLEALASAKFQQTPWRGLPTTGFSAPHFVGSISEGSLEGHSQRPHSRGHWARPVG